jgi:hypothetical protein
MSHRGSHFATRVSCAMMSKNSSEGRLMEYPKGIETYLKKWDRPEYHKHCRLPRRAIINRAAIHKTPENLLAASKTFGEGHFESESLTAEYEEATARADHDAEQEQCERSQQTGYDIYVE